MSCGKMNWKKAMQIAREEYPNMSLKKRKKVAGNIISKARE